MSCYFQTCNFFYSINNRYAFCFVRYHLKQLQDFVALLLIIEMPCYSMILTCRPTHTHVLPVAVLGQHAHENRDALNLFSVCNRFYLTWKYNVLVAWNLYCVLGSPKYAGSKCRRPSRAVGAVKLSVSRPSRLTMHVNYFNFWGYPSEINRPTCTRHNYIADTTQLWLHCIL